MSRSESLGRKLWIRSLVYVAGEPIPYFWPMRNFIHHNPLHGFEHRPFEEAVQTGGALFRGRTFLPRHRYQRYVKAGRLDPDDLLERVRHGLDDDREWIGHRLSQWLWTDLMQEETPLGCASLLLATPQDVHAVLQGSRVPSRAPDREALRRRLERHYLNGLPLHEALDALFGLGLTEELDELVVKSCLDFLDEGQSVWDMPGREHGFFRAWRTLALRSGRLFFKGLHLREVLGDAEQPEAVIGRILETLEVPEPLWLEYLQHEIARLHGWAGFIRWRSGAAHYYWSQRHPADLVDYVAIRLAFSAALMHQTGRRGLPATYTALRRMVEERTEWTFLHAELHTGQALPSLASELERALELDVAPRIQKLFVRYTESRRRREAQLVAERLRRLADRLGCRDRLARLDAEGVSYLMRGLEDLERREGMLWLEAFEARAISDLAGGVGFAPDPERPKRPFAQALFCIDTRSERIRRHLEGVGDYETYGIAGFFGVPLSFIALTRGSENHLCPVLLTPRNLVLEVPAFEFQDEQAVTVLGKVLHELKESVLAPFVTVEAVGLLFGFDMIGKTLFPATYGTWRKRMGRTTTLTRLLVDKISRERADSIIRAVQRAVIEKVIEHELGLPTERVTDDMVRTLREAAMGHAEPDVQAFEAAGLDAQAVHALVRRLREDYRINPDQVRLQMERLGRIGFTLNEQVGYVSQALRSIGLTSGFSRFVLLVGHGSTSDNNPYESALDCGACGGNHGLVNARVLAQMANRPEVRNRLRQQGIDIPDDTWFIPALHDTTTDEIRLHDVELIPSTHLVYMDRLRNGLIAASRRCAAERMPTLTRESGAGDPARAHRIARRNAVDWSQVRPEWGLSGNLYFIIGRRAVTRKLPLYGRAFLHSYDYRLDPKRRLLENILTGPLVVGQWINMEHYFSTVDNERFGSGSKVYHNVAGRFGVMTGNLSDLRTGLPAQTVLKEGAPYHEPLRLITLVEAPLDHARLALEEVISVRRLAENGWLRFLVMDPEAGAFWEFGERGWPVRIEPDGHETGFAGTPALEASR